MIQIGMTVKKYLENKANDLRAVYDNLDALNDLKG